jgi:hypothetical protein
MLQPSFTLTENDYCNVKEGGTVVTLLTTSDDFEVNE